MWFSFKNGNFDSKMKVSRFLGIQPRYNIFEFKFILFDVKTERMSQFVQWYDRTVQWYDFTVQDPDFIYDRDKIWHDCYRRVMLRWLNIWNWLCFNCILRNEQFTQMIHIPVTMWVISSQREVLKEQGFTDWKDFDQNEYTHPWLGTIRSVNPWKEHL